jgi:hypothetical protein
MPCHGDSVLKIGGAHGHVVTVKEKLKEAGKE